MSKFVLRRAHYTCELCGGFTPTARIMRLLDTADIRAAGLVPRLSDHIDNLALVCADCESRRGTVNLHSLLVLAVRRSLDNERTS